ncbi:MAG: ABC transporter permease [Christensenellales bacterium]|jgi:ribose transport system permease protein
MKERKTNMNSTLKAVIGPLLAVLILAGMLAVIHETFLKTDNLMNILRQLSINAVVSIGMLLVLLTGGIDLSVGSTAAVSACVMGVLLKAGVDSAFILIPVALIVGLVVGLCNGLLFTKLNLPHPFVSTMGMMQMLRGLALLITGASPITGFPKSVTYLGFANVWGIPVCFIVVILIVMVFSIFLKRTALGRRIYTVGGNKEAARLSGINVPRTLNFVYTMSGVLAAFGGILLVGRVGTAFPLAGEGYEMDAVAACVIGGASFSGGRGTVAGTLIGSLLIAIVNNGLNLLGAQSDIKNIVIGAVIIIAVLIDVMRGSASERVRRLSQIKGEAQA